MFTQMGIGHALNRSWPVNWISVNAMLTFDLRKVILLKFSMSNIATFQKSFLFLSYIFEFRHRILYFKRCIYFHQFFSGPDNKFWQEKKKSRSAMYHIDLLPQKILASKLSNFHLIQSQQLMGNCWNFQRQWKICKLTKKKMRLSTSKPLMMRTTKVVQSQPSLAAVEVIGAAAQSLDSLNICFFAGFKV